MPVRCVSTGVKHLHHAAEDFSIGVYFEANGHGTVLFSEEALRIIRSARSNDPGETASLDILRGLALLINQTVGDALSDMLLVEAILAHRKWSPSDWDSLYSDLPNRLVKVSVPDRNLFTTENAERQLVTPLGLQSQIDELVKGYRGGRGFVRPSGTEDVVRVYAEADTRESADGRSYIATYRVC
jgi:phosphoacetylglucosamine mutase